MRRKRKKRKIKRKSFKRKKAKVNTRNARAAPPLHPVTVQKVAVIVRLATKLELTKKMQPRFQRRIVAILMEKQKNAIALFPDLVIMEKGVWKSPIPADMTIKESSQQA